jgi:activator of HSP90 ATPase
MKSIEGQASITIRKQKQLFLYDFEMEIYYNCVRDDQDKFEEEDEKSVKGTFKVHEFNQEDDDEELNIDVTQEKSSELSALSKKIVKKEISAILLKTIGALKGAMKDKDSDEIKVAMDKAKREEAKKTVEVAKA